MSSNSLTSLEDVSSMYFPFSIDSDILERVSKSFIMKSDKYSVFLGDSSDGGALR